MARRLRLEFPGAIYHVVNRGNRNENIFRDDTDRGKFLETLEEACAKTAWGVHAFCLMPDHFHLVIETPRPNLVSGMKWLLGTYTGRFNRRHGQTGHLFRGRYRSQIIGASGGFLRAVGDYVHLNPVRAGLVGPAEPLRDYSWTSFPAFLRPPGLRPGWLQTGRMLDECGISKDDRAGRLAFERRLEQLRGRDLREECETVRKRWFLGDETLRRELLELAVARVGKWHYGPEVRETAEDRAEQLIGEELAARRWTLAELANRRKGDADKIAIAKRLRSETTVSMEWIAGRLHMGKRGYLTHLLYWDGKEKPRRRGSRKESSSRGTDGAKDRSMPAAVPELSNAPKVSSWLDEFDVRFD